MRCVAVIEAERPGLDSVILWEHDGRLVAFAYEDGQVRMTRPLDADTIDPAVAEIQASFQINAGQLARVTNWIDTTIRAEPLQGTQRRWGA